MKNCEKILVIIDPEHGTQPALERALANADIRESDEKSHLILLVTATPKNGDKSGQNGTAYRDLNWVNGLQQSINDKGLTSECLISWSRNWSTNILNIAKDQEIDMVMVPFYGQQDDKHLISDEKWTLLRKCESPVLLVRPGREQQRKSILVSLKIQDDSYADINKRILERGAWAAKRYGAELHAVNAYSDSMEFPDRNKVSRITNIGNSNIHFQHGDPEEVIAKVASKVNADMVLIGTKKRSGIKAALRGNTIEKIAGNISQDIMLMV